MKPTDLKDLIQGLLAVILLSIAIGQYDQVRKFAVKEVVQALKPGRSFPDFFLRETSRQSVKRNKESLEFQN